MLVAVLKLTGKGWMDEIMAKPCWANWLSWSRKGRRRTYGFESSHGWWISQASLCALDYLVFIILSYFWCPWVASNCEVSETCEHLLVPYNWWSFGVFEQALRFGDMSWLRLPALCAKWDDMRWNGVSFFPLAQRGETWRNGVRTWAWPGLSIAGQAHESIDFKVYNKHPDSCRRMSWRMLKVFKDIQRCRQRSSLHAAAGQVNWASPAAFLGGWWVAAVPSLCCDMLWLWRIYPKKSRMGGEMRWNWLSLSIFATIHLVFVDLCFEIPRISGCLQPTKDNPILIPWVWLLSPCKIELLLGVQATTLWTGTMPALVALRVLQSHQSPTSWGWWTSIYESWGDGPSPGALASYKLLETTWNNQTLSNFGDLQPCFPISGSCHEVPRFERIYLILPKISWMVLIQWRWPVHGKSTAHLPKHFKAGPRWAKLHEFGIRRSRRQKIASFWRFAMVEGDLKLWISTW